MVEKLKEVKNQMASDSDKATELISKSKEEVKDEIVNHITQLNETIISTSHAKLTTGRMLYLFLNCVLFFKM